MKIEAKEKRQMVTDKGLTNDDKVAMSSHVKCENLPPMVSGDQA